MIFVLIVLLIIALWKWWSYRCLVMGLIYFAMTVHDWDINEAEIKKILKYSMERNIQDFFKS